MFDGDAALHDPGVASLVEFALNKDKGLGAMRKPSSLRLVRRQRLTEEIVEVERPPVDQRVGLYHQRTKGLYWSLAKTPVGTGS